MELANFYMYIKALHIIAFTTWMAGLFYLPRLFVYHSSAKGRELNDTFKTMERKLLKYIMNPSFILTWVLGTLLILTSGIAHEGWLNIKLLLVVLMSGFHMFCARQVRMFAVDRNKYSEKFYRITNEVPTVLFVIIIFRNGLR